jgi:hypothetical protein
MEKEKGEGESEKEFKVKKPGIAEISEKPGWWP